MYGYGYRYNSGLVIGAGGGAPFANISSLSFDGVDDYVSCGNITELDNVTSATWSIWSNSLITTSYHYLMSCYSGGFKQYLFKQSTNKLDIFLSDSGGSLRLCNTINFTFTVGVWYHVAIVYDETEVSNSDKVKVYIDGVLQSNTVAGFALTSLYVSKGNPTEIGKAGGFTSNQYNGNLDEVCILDRAVTPTEIVTLSTAPTVDLTDLNPIAWYRNGDNGSWKSPQWLIPNNENFAANKVSNYSLDFDGVDDFIDCGNGTDLQITGALTLSVWTKLSSSVGSQSCIISKDNGSSQRAFSLWGIITNKPVFYIWNGGANYNVGGTTNIADDTWHHVAVVYVPSTSLRIYVDGILEGTNTTSIPASINNASQNLYLGQFASSLFEFKGLMDSVSIFNSDQSSNILSIYNGGVPNTISGATAHYKMGEDSTFSGGVWTVPDSVGSNTGTSANMTIEDRIGEAPNSTSNAVSFNMDEVDRVNDTP